MDLRWSQSHGDLLVAKTWYSLTGYRFWRRPVMAKSAIHILNKPALIIFAKMRNAGLRT